MFTRSVLRKSAAFILVALALLVFTMAAAETTRDSAYQSDIETFSSQPVTIMPDDPAKYSTSSLTPEEQEAMHLKLLDLRDSIDAKVNPNPVDRYNLQPVPEAIVPETVLDNTVSEYDGSGIEAPEDYVLGRNRKNPFANTVGSTLAEPAAVNNSKHFLFLGNTYASYTKTAGGIWTEIPIPGGPAEAPNPCCDPDVIHDEARGVSFWSMLYLNEAATQGAIRIFVRPSIYQADTCSYTIFADPDVIPDYPHLGHSNEFLYITMNNVSTAGGGWLGSQVYRYDIDAMANCAAASGSVYTYSGGDQRVFVPAEGIWSQMYWGMLETDSSFRIFWWHDTSGTVFSQVVSISTSTHNNPDCRGGVGNFDFIERSTSYSMTGFRLRGARAQNPVDGSNQLWFWWNASNDGSFPNALIRAAVFNETDKALVSQPHIWSPSTCFGYPAAAVNKRGNIGMAMALGGIDGGGGAAAQGYTGIIDDYNWPAISLVFITATGTHNRSDGRFGDYFTVRPHTPCNLVWVSTSYSLENGDAVANVNARYSEFMRERDYTCYYEWRLRHPYER
jgi:hypothetical protein